MHRRFRFCGRIALALPALVAITAMAQEPEAAPAAPPSEETNTAIPLPTPGKHQLKVTPLQMVQHQAEVLERKVETQGSLIVSLTQQIEEQKKEIDTLKEQNETLSTNLTMLEGQVSAMADTVEELSHPEESTGATVTPPPAASESRSETDNTASHPAPPASGRSHIVERGENLITIARKYGTSAQEIRDLNNIRDERKLQIGQRLALPASANAE